MAEMGILRDLTVIFVVAVVVVALLRRIGLPSIAGFILAGTIVGPRGLGFVEDSHQVELLAEIGVALLLFGIGLELQLARLRRLWRPVLLGGTLQVAATAGATVLIAARLGIAIHSAVFLGLVLAVSSTAVVLRGLEQRGEVDAPHGRLTLGILVFQDLSVIPMMMAIPLLAGAGRGDVAPEALVDTTLRAVGVLAGFLLAARIVVPRALDLVARTRQRDLFVLTVLLVSIGTAWLVSTAGVSLALGAFLAGMVVAGSEYRHQAMADVIPFREVLTSLFFVSIGMLLDPAILWERPGLVAGLIAGIVPGKFVVVFLTAAALRLPVRVCAIAAASLAQVGEFSFVLLFAAAGTGLVPPALLDPLIAAIILSMLVTPLLIAAGPQIAAGVGRIRPLMRLLDVRGAEDADAGAESRRDHVIIAGFGVTGQELARSLRDCGVPYVIVDLNPANVRAAARAGEPVYYGDVTSPEVLEHLGAARALAVILVVNDPSAAERAVGAIRRAAPRVHVLARARYIADIGPLLRAGADEVVAAETEAAVEVAVRVLGRRGIPRERIEAELERIRARRDERFVAETAAFAAPRPPEH